MDSINSIAGSSALANPTAASEATGALGGFSTQDFLELLITELTNQDPLEPTDNEAMLQQISSIREIELSSELTDSLKSLTDQQSVGSAAGLIGQFVQSKPASDGLVVEGVVTSVRFDSSGSPVLVLDNGAQLPMAEVGEIRQIEEVADALVGQEVVGIDSRDDDKRDAVRGVVSGVRAGDDGKPVLELDTGEDLLLSDVAQVKDPNRGLRK